MAMLELHDVHTFYGSIEALKGVTLEVNEGEIVTLIGANGAGKSTTLRSISGLTPPRLGSIRFEGQEIGATPAPEIVRLGISQSPEGRKVFQRMSVRENLDLGAFLRRDDRVNDDLDRVYDLFPRLKEREHQKGGTMPEMDRSVVDFPAPLDPMSVTISPSRTSSETPFSASIEP